MTQEAMKCNTCERGLSPWGKHIVLMTIALKHDPLSVKMDEKKVLDTKYYCDEKCLATGRGVSVNPKCVGDYAQLGKNIQGMEGEVV